LIPSVPEGSFIDLYMKAQQDKETATLYDFWAAIYLIGACCGRDVIVDRPASPVYLNWYIVFASESGKTRKSTAIREVQRCLNGLGHNNDYGLIISAKTPPETLEKSLAKRTREVGDARCNIISSEMVTILGREGYMAGMPGLLTDLYDCADRRLPNRDREGELTHANVFTTLLTASTPSWLVTAINPQVVEGGFASRVIFVCASQRKRAIAWGGVSTEKVGSDRIIESLDIAGRNAREVGKITANERGLRRFTQWYNTRPSSFDPFESSFESREDDHVLRLAACLAINDGSFELQDGHIRSSCRAITDIKANAIKLFGRGTSSSSRFGDGIDGVRRNLVKAGHDGIQHSKLYNNVRRNIDTKEFKVLIEVMKECGYIDVFEVGSGTKKKKIYRATRAIESLDVTSNVLGKISPHQS